MKIQNLEENIKSFQRKSSKILTKSQSIVQSFENLEIKNNNSKFDIQKKPHNVEEKNRSSFRSSLIIEQEYARNSEIINYKEIPGNAGRASYLPGFFKLN